MRKFSGEGEFTATAPKSSLAVCRVAANGAFIASHRHFKYRCGRPRASSSSIFAGVVAAQRVLCSFDISVPLVFSVVVDIARQVFLGVRGFIH